MEFKRNTKLFIVQILLLIMPNRKNVSKKSKKNINTLLSEEQVLLSKERTILTFMNTAVAFIGVGLITVNVFKDSAFQLIGYMLIIVGFVEIGESVRRLKKKQKNLSRIEKQTGV